MFSFRYFLKKIGVLNSYFIHRYIIIKYGQVRFRVKSTNFYESYGPFFNFIFLQNACVWVRIFLFKTIGVLDSYFIHRYIIIKKVKFDFG